MIKLGAFGQNQTVYGPSLLLITGKNAFFRQIATALSYKNTKNIKNTKQTKLIPNMALKVVNGYYIKRYDQFKFVILKV